MALFIVSTPIGNLKDITFRAIEVLQNANYILSENTKTTFNLLSHYNILGKKIIPFTDHSNEKEVLKFLEDAKIFDIALVSEAGTPIICDPGYKLISNAIQSGVQVRPIPGASSLVSAISVCGLPMHNFAFLGFYERSKIKKITEFLNTETSVILFLPARDILKVINELCQILENHKIAITRELTKIYEDIKFGTCEEILKYYTTEKLKGEAVLLISGFKEKKQDENLEVLLTNALNEKEFLKSLKKSEIAEVLNTYEPSLKNFSKKQIYNALLKVIF